MKKQEKAIYLIEALEKQYPHVPIPLDHRDHFSLLVAVLLSAQCTDERVNTVTPTLFKAANNPASMAQLEVAEIESIIRPCGLAPAKSKNIHKLSQILIEKHGGAVPESFEDLEALPGVGHKTASVVMSQGFGHPAFPVDTHIHRLMWRWALSDGSTVEQTERDAKRLFPEDKWNKLHLQIIFYGREFSPARGYRLSKDYITQKIGRKSFIKQVSGS